MEIFTIGHSNYSVQELLERLQYYHVNCVADIRGTPYSKYNIQFNKEAIKESLIQHGYKYIYMGKEFAAQREDRSLYFEEGYSDFEKVLKDKDFLSGIERLKSGCENGYRIVLLGAMQDPIRCHRCALLGRGLRAAGFEVRHILDDYSLASQEELEERMLEKYNTHKGQIVLADLMGTMLSREEELRECYRKSNREIGFRVEKIKQR